MGTNLLAAGLEAMWGLTDLEADATWDSHITYNHLPSRLGGRKK